jgi:hypothetical protein
MLTRSFDPVPPGTFYASVWAGAESTMTLEFSGDFLPVGNVETVFVENTEREPGTVVAVAEQVSPDTWQARFVLPHAGIWNAQHSYLTVLRDGTLDSGGGSFALQAVSQTPARPIVVTRNDQPLPGCQPREVADLLVTFFDAFNRGDTAHLRSSFGPQFQWHSVTEHDLGEQGRHFVAFHADDALAYFDARHQRGERLDLLALDVAATGDIGFFAARQADDLPPGPEDGAWAMLGKGKIDCMAHTIDVLSMGMGIDQVNQPLAVLIARMCEPPDATASDTIVACSRSTR